MARLLLIAGIIFLLWIGYRFLKNTWSERINEVENKERKNANLEQHAAQHKVQQIKACAYCKTHIPEDEGIDKDGQFFCSYQHLDYYLEHKHDNTDS